MARARPTSGGAAGREAAITGCGRGPPELSVVTVGAIEGSGALGPGGTGSRREEGRVQETEGEDEIYVANEEETAEKD